MKITIKKLRKYIKEEVERNLRWSAGFFGGGNIQKSRKGVEPPPPGLGSEGETNKENEKNTTDNSDDTEQKSQTAARVDDRARS